MILLDSCDSKLNRSACANFQYGFSKQIRFFKWMLIKAWLIVFNLLTLLSLIYKSGNGVSVKMPPRLSARRLLLIILFFASLTLLIGIHQHIPWPPNVLTRASSQNQEQQSESDENNNNNNNEEVIIAQEIQHTTTQNTNLLNEIKNNVDENRENEEKRPKEKAWFFSGGTELPKKFQGIPKLLPNDNDGDRIVDQLMYIPEDYQGFDTREKLILAYNGLGTWGQKTGPTSFYNCPVNRCSLTDDRNRAEEADAILYKDHFIHPGISRKIKQIWIMYYLECPYHTQGVKFSNLINWTATYRRDSDLVAPYERWTYYDEKIKQKNQNYDFSANKTRKVAWFVSNCGARNGRLAYARELSKYISVDIYGTCGPLKCPRTDSKCFELLDSDYKFYLAFENSNCRDYITEKFYVNGLGRNVIPIVMGARPEDYQRSAPEGSYIHVDEFANPAELASYLHRLDNDNVLYNSYFKWKGTGEFINTYFWCRLCAMLHAPLQNKHYEDVNEWWRGSGICTPKSWRNIDVE